MNRKILFRGKRMDNGEWVIGSLIKMGPTGHARYFILPDYASAFYEIAVDPYTVGQYTGMTDQNGKKIFEGDIVESTDDYGSTDGLDCGHGDVSVVDGLWYVAGDVHNALYDINDCRYIEVIGNIHDNPELVGGETDETD